MKEIKVSSVKDYIKALEAQRLKKTNEFLVYRGQANSSWILAPRLAREIPFQLAENEIKDFNMLEEKIHNDFRRWIPSFYPHYPEDEISTLCLGQHYGLYTRLLDWTQNPLIALWFALNTENKEKKKTDAAVWVLGYDSEDILEHDKGFKISDLSMTRILYPKFNDKRISSQASIFTIHALTKKGRFISLEENRNFKSSLIKIAINKNKLYSIKNELAQFVTKHMIFQDLPALCDDINDKHSLALAMMSL